MEPFEKLCQHVRETAQLKSIEALLDWDQQTGLPPQASEYRADQLTLISSLVHKRRTDPRIGDQLNELESLERENPNSPEGATVRCIRREFEKEKKKPLRLVEELTRCTSQAQHVWAEARKKNHFESFRPSLEQVIRLQQETADAVGYAECRYDALLDDYEPEFKTSDVRRILNGLREGLVPLVAARADDDPADADLLHRNFPVSEQQKLGAAAAEAIGFDFSRGRLDVTSHPFCTELGPNDCRITTRYDEKFFSSAFFGILHEAGHGIYEQGLPTEWYGLPPGQHVSLGVHESQSRLWENQVGRGEPFWRHFFPMAQQHFPDALGDIALDKWMKAVNAVQPSLIRVEADELTYNLHIIIRFELEQELIEGELAVADLPDAWNQRYTDYLGITPPSDAEGVLQDVHWSAGLFGYFATYTLGNLYSAQLFEKADADTGGLAEPFTRGEFQPLLAWLRENVHRHGRCYPAHELIERATGQPLTHTALIRRLSNRA